MEKKGEEEEQKNKEEKKKENKKKKKKKRKRQKEEEKKKKKNKQPRSPEIFGSKPPLDIIYGIKRAHAIVRVLRTVAQALISLLVQHSPYIPTPFNTATSSTVSFRPNATFLSRALSWVDSQVPSGLIRYSLVLGSIAGTLPLLPVPRSRPRL